MNVRLTDFADYTDLVAFIEKATTFLTSSELEQCLEAGDNGVGASGLTTATDQTRMVALPKADIIRVWGSLANGWQKPVRVKYGNLSAVGILADLSDNSSTTSNNICDLNPAMLKALSQIHPLSVPGDWTPA